MTSEESPTKKTIAPLSLNAVKERYSEVFQVYVTLSDREKATAECLSDQDEPPPVNKEGLCTTIMFVDFTKAICENTVSEHITSDETYKFCMFLWKLLDACESGSIGGEACRMWEVLSAALNDIHNIRGNGRDKFEHLLAWTIAARSHGLYPLLYRGMPDPNQLFKAAGDMWKKVFEYNDSKTPFMSD